MLYRMGFGMRMEQRPSLQIEQSARHELRQELVQKMGYHAESIRDAGPDASDNLLQSVLDGILDGLDDENLREGLRTLFSDGAFRQKILDSAALLAVPTPEHVRDVVLNYFYDAHRGEFPIEDAGGEGQEEGREPEVVKTPYARFREAFITPSTTREKIAESVRLLPEQKASGGDPTGLERVRDEAVDALRATDLSRSHIETLMLALNAVLKKREGGKPGLSDFLRDVAVMEKLDFILSERVQRRFADKFSRVGEKTSSESMKNAFLNAIGEYVLVSMGIVHPDVFQLNRGMRDISAYEDAKSDFSDAGLDLDDLLRQSRLQGPGTFFLHRWKTLGRAPSPITDELVRAFITQTVRADAERILEAAGYEAFFEKVRSTCREGELKDKEEVANDLCSELAETLAEETFETVIINLIRDKWYAKLDMFYRRT